MQDMFTYSNVFQFSAGPIDYLQETLHHSTTDECLAACLVTGEMIEETEERRGQGQWEGLAVRLGRRQRCDARSYEYREKSVIRARPGHVDYHVQS